MADNVQAETVSVPGITFATDDIAGIHHPKTKMEWGPSDTATQVDTGAAALPIQDGGNSLTVDGTVTANAGTGTFTVDSELPAAAALADATANPTTPLVGAAIEIFNGTTWDRARGDTTNGIDVDITRSVLPTGAATSAAQLPDGHNVTVDNGAGAAAVNVQDGGNSLTVDNATLAVVGGGTEAAALRVTIASDSTGVLSIDDNGASLTIDGTVTANLAAGTNNIGDVDILSIAAGDNNIGNVDIVSLPASTNTIEIVGDAAHDAAAAGNPVLVGAQMETMADSAPGTRAGTDGDANKLATTDGALFVVPSGPQNWSYHEDSSSALTDATVHAAPGAGLSLYVQTIVVSTGAATALNVFFEEGASKVLGPYYLEAVAGRGFVINFLSPKKITANTALTVTTSAAIAHAIDVTGYIAPG